MVNTVILNDIEYMIIDAINMDGSLYAILINVNDEKDFCFKKIIVKDGKEYFNGLSSREEFEKVLIKFTEKMIEN